MNIPKKDNKNKIILYRNSSTFRSQINKSSCNEGVPKLDFRLINRMF